MSMAIRHMSEMALEVRDAMIEEMVRVVGVNEERVMRRKVGKTDGSRVAYVRTVSRQSLFPFLFVSLSYSSHCVALTMNDDLSYNFLCLIYFQLELRSGSNNVLAQWPCKFQARVLAFTIHECHAGRCYVSRLTRY